MVGQEGLFSLLRINLTFLRLHFQSKFCDLILRRQLFHSHHSAESEAPCRHKLSTHHSVKHLVEVDEAIIDVDSHLEHSSIDFLVRGK